MVRKQTLVAPLFFFCCLFFNFPLSPFFDMKVHLNTQSSFMSMLTLQIDSWPLIFELWKPHSDLELPNHQLGVGERDQSLSGSLRCPGQEEA